ncbi:MAG: hypothetical protein ACYCQI_02045 [Gammaproteobacteria bacterium]
MKFYVVGSLIALCDVTVVPGAKGGTPYQKGPEGFSAESLREHFPKDNFRIYEKKEEAQFYADTHRKMIKNSWGQYPIFLIEADDKHIGLQADGVMILSPKQVVRLISVRLKIDEKYTFEFDYQQPSLKSTLRKEAYEVKASGFVGLFKTERKGEKSSLVSSTTASKEIARPGGYGSFS